MISTEKTMKVEHLPPGYEENSPYPAVMNHPNHQNIPSKDEFAGRYNFTFELVLLPQGKHWTVRSRKNYKNIFANIAKRKKS